VRLVILPELVEKWFTKQKTILSEEQTAQQCDDFSNEDEQVWCCKIGEDCGAMIGCDNEECPIQWFHFSRLNVMHHRKLVLSRMPQIQKRLYNGIIMLEINKLYIPMLTLLKLICISFTNQKVQQNHNNYIKHYK